MTPGGPPPPDPVGLAVARRCLPETLRDVARCLGSESDRLVDEVRLLRAAVPGRWVGPAAEEARDRGDALGSALRLAGAAASTGCAALRHAARELGAAAALVLRAEAVARSEGGYVDDGGRLVAPPAALPADPTLVAAVLRERARTAAEVEALTARAAATARSADAALARALDPDVRGRGGEGRWSTPALVVPPLPGSGEVMAPYAEASWWRGLSHEQRRAILRTRPELIGPLDGLPAAARHEANLVLLASAEERADRALAAVEDGATPRPDVLLGVGFEGRTVGRLERRRVVELAALRSVLEQGDGLPRRLLLVDDSGPYLRAVVAIGDPDTARHVATYVGGLTTSVGGDLQRYDRVLGEARAVASGPLLGEELAVVTWMGYEAPQVTEILDPRGRSVLGEEVAVRAAPALGRFLLGLDAARDDDPHQTVWAHSYGTVVAGHALRLNTGVDDVVLFGSPGVPLAGLASAGLKAGALNVLRAPYDLVAYSGWHGRDPVDIPGATLLGTGPATLSDGTQLKPSSGHSEYVVPGSTSAWNLVAVAVGRRDLRVPAEEGG